MEIIFWQNVAAFFDFFEAETPLEETELEFEAVLGDFAWLLIKLLFSNWSLLLRIASGTSSKSRSSGLIPF